MMAAGSTVLVRLAPSDAASATRYRSGMISDANDGDDDGDCPTYDVIYDEADNNNAADQQGQGREEEEDEEDGVAADRVLGVPASPSVWCAARLNLARCSFRRGKHSEVSADKGAAERRRRREGGGGGGGEGGGGVRWRVVARMIPPVGPAERGLFRGWHGFGVFHFTSRVWLFWVFLALALSSCVLALAASGIQFPSKSFPTPKSNRVLSEIRTLTRTANFVVSQVVEACTLVLVVARLTMAEKERPREERSKLRNHCLTALRMRGGSHLAQHHVGLARKDARCVDSFVSCGLVA